jgi:hypothetical protein
MLQRRAQEATRNSLAWETLGCKRLYTAAAEVVEPSKQNGLNTFISKSARATHLDCKSAHQQDDNAGGVYLALN